MQILYTTITVILQLALDIIILIAFNFILHLLIKGAITSEDYLCNKIFKKKSEPTGLELAQQKLEEHINKAHAVGAYHLANRYMEQLEVVKAIKKAQDAKIKAEKQSEWDNKAAQALDDVYD